MNSTMAVRKWFRVFGVVALATFVVPGVRAQQTQVQTQDTTMLSEFPQPKDPRTRATMHTELASLYFEDGNLIVALEELTLATAIDPTYAPAFSTRGLVLYYVKELDSAEKDQRALSLDERSRISAIIMVWFLCQTGREKNRSQVFRTRLQKPDLPDACQCLFEFWRLPDQAR